MGAWPGTPDYQPDLGPQHILKGAAIRADATPEYLGVGYIIGPRVAGVMFAGGVFSWLVLMPAIYFFGIASDRAAVSGDEADCADVAERAVVDLCAADGRGGGGGGGTDHAAEDDADDCGRADAGLEQDAQSSGG